MEGYEEYIRQTQSQLEGKRGRSRSPSLSNTELRALKCRVDTGETYKVRELTPMQRKRRSLNLSFSPPAQFTSEVPSSPDFRFAFQRNSFNRNPKRSSMSMSMSDFSATTSPTVDSSNRWSSISSNSRSSFISSHSSEGDHIQERLQQLARTENAKLSNDDLCDLGISEPSTETTDAYSTTTNSTPNNYNSHHRRHYSDQFNNYNDAYRPSNHSSSNRNSMMYVIPDEELQKITTINESHENDTNTKTNASPGPSRPGNISGTLLSWQMTSDIVRTSAKSATTSPRDLPTLMKFIWSMFSNPSNFHHFEYKPANLVPPAHVIKDLKHSLPGWKVAMQRLGNLFKSIACTGFSFSILLVQVVLIGIMVLAYVVGDVLVTPFKTLNDTFLKSNHQKKAEKVKKLMNKKRISRKLK